MCGLAGFVDLNVSEDIGEQRLSEMLRTITHRGPDSSGIWFDKGIAIGHCRLSIVDLSPLGHQPMKSISGRYILAYNGEIYNHLELRDQLQQRGVVLSGHSDTEVLLALIEQCGLEGALRQCIGMFALALWDVKESRLQLARDRFGEKPLYYSWQNSSFLFGSEIKALRTNPNFERRIDPYSTQLFLRYGYIPSPHSIYEDTWKLDAGCILSLSIDQINLSVNRRIVKHSIRRYWSHIDNSPLGSGRPYVGTYQEACNQLEAILDDSIRLQMQADVPVGAFLSGGIDSSLILALMQRQSSNTVKSFTIGFEKDDLNEAHHAKAVAEFVGTNHTELYVTHEDALNVIPKLPRIFDEPFADPSQIPTYLVAGMAKQEVTVSLSGDGADELFCGYPKYWLGEKFAKIPFRCVIADLVGVLPWQLIEQACSLVLSGKKNHFTQSRFETLHAYLSAPTLSSIADIASMVNRNPEKLLNTNHRTVVDRNANIAAGVSSKDYKRLAMYLDKERYLAEDILTKVDRATMSVSLESRAPFLDHRVATFAASLPNDFLVHGSSGKKILKDILFRHIPRHLVERPKAGFNIPLADWLRTDLREWALDMLIPEATDPDQLINMQYCRSILEEHVSGVKNHAAKLWPILMLKAWQNEW